MFPFPDTPFPEVPFAHDNVNHLMTNFFMICTGGPIIPNAVPTDRRPNVMFAVGSDGKPIYAPPLSPLSAEEAIEIMFPKKTYPVPKPPAPPVIPLPPIVRPNSPYMGEGWYPGE
jgi:hypothetical protein